MKTRSHQLPSLAQIKAYIQGNGWKEQRSPLPNAYVFSNEQGVDLVLPKDNGLVDADIRLRSALDTLAAIEDTSIEKLTIAISNIFSDLIRVSIGDTVIKGDTIPLGLASEFLCGLKDLMAYSATSEELKLPHFQRTLKKGIEFSESCRFGHTFVGSFGFSVACPLERKTQVALADNFEEPPFERKVVQRLYRGMAHAQEGFRKEDISYVTKGFDSGLSANMAEQIACLHEIAKNSDIKYAFAWSPEWKIDPDLLNQPILTVDYNFAEFIRCASKSMREEEQVFSENFTGMVVGLKSKGLPSDDDDTSSREITIHLDGDEPIVNELKFVASKADYLKALEAHKNGQHVRFKATLEKTKKTWKVVEYTGFDVA